MSLCQGSSLKRDGEKLDVTGQRCCINAGKDTVLAGCGVDGGEDRCCGDEGEDLGGCE